MTVLAGGANAKAVRQAGSEWKTLTVAGVGWGLRDLGLPLRSRVEGVA